MCLWSDTSFLQDRNPFHSFLPFSSCTLSAPSLQFNLVLLNELMKREGEHSSADRWQVLDLGQAAEEVGDWSLLPPGTTTSRMGPCIVHKDPRTGESGLVLCGGMELCLPLQLFTG